MTCTLILTRHAKSAWDTSAPSDHARPLNNRGRHSAAAVGTWLREIGMIPDQVISSSAQRTRETCDLMELGAPAVFIERLYHASAEILFQVLREAEHKRVLVLGHNPGLAAFAHSIVRHPPDHSRFDDFPTGATLIARFDIDSWADLTWSSGKVAEFTVPRELLGA
ncbi:histidine phosphatase family protein [Phaeobacter sp. LSS9]|uniref:Phosphoglycerate mutase-like protein n=1 Tax=Phaeobacter piscinae TaxID=1580596 RepID=A0AAN1GTC1_9RHOB|nr:MULTISPECIES: histidine phosphatase family protein [Phaeobacter]ATG44766.1 phosphoglycerate mutase-like protein [Phaeobacter piscinae]AUQ73091.1 phosphoglycerate mutase-like protein [Phaeobacter piscinae]AUR37080.1 phosphoglycerate mutase-like protein [Phaeobacter piscinae]AXT35298.1 histidine phosphatase family protein [Phaeobacter sp. LSS9]